MIEDRKMLRYFTVAVREDDPISFEYSFELRDINSELVIPCHEEFDELDVALAEGVKMAEMLNGSPFPDNYTFDCVIYTSDDLKEIEVVKRRSPDVAALKETYRQAIIDDGFADRFAAYKRLNGRIARDRCKDLLDLFDGIVSCAARGEPADAAMLFEAEDRDVCYREVAMDRWTEMLKRLGHAKGEAFKLWRAVDAVHPIS